MLSIHRKDSPLILSCIAEDRLIRISQISFTIFINCQYIMAQCAQGIYNRQRKIFVRIQSGHDLFFVFLDLLLNFLLVGGIIGPGISEILGAQRRIYL